MSGRLRLPLPRRTSIGEGNEGLTGSYCIKDGKTASTTRHSSCNAGEPAIRRRPRRSAPEPTLRNHRSSTAGTAARAWTRRRGRRRRNGSSITASSILWRNLRIGPLEIDLVGKKGRPRRHRRSPHARPRIVLKGRSRASRARSDARSSVRRADVFRGSASRRCPTSRAPAHRRRGGHVRRRRREACDRVDPRPRSPSRTAGHLRGVAAGGEPGEAETACVLERT